ncbi:g51 [Coccomyxa elongata]
MVIWCLYGGGKSLHTFHLSTTSSPRLFGETSRWHGNARFHNIVPRSAQCQQQTHKDRHERITRSQEGLSRRALLVSLLGVVQLGAPVFAAEQPVGPSPGNEVHVEVPLPTTHTEDDRAVPRGLRPGKPLPAQPIEDPTKRPIAEGQFSPEAAGKPMDARPVPESSTQPVPGAAVPKDGSSPKQPKSASSDDADKEAKKLLDEEEERRKQRRRKKGRIRELEEIRAELAEKELVLLSKEQELLEKDQTVAVLREELELEKKLRTLLTKEKEKAEEQSALALGLCTGGSIF